MLLLLVLPFVVAIEYECLHNVEFERYDTKLETLSQCLIEGYLPNILYSSSIKDQRIVDRVARNFPFRLVHQGRPFMPRLHYDRSCVQIVEGFFPLGAAHCVLPSRCGLVRYIKAEKFLFITTTYLCYGEHAFVVRNESVDVYQLQPALDSDKCFQIRFFEEDKQEQQVCVDGNDFFFGRHSWIGKPHGPGQLMPNRCVDWYRTANITSKFTMEPFDKNGQVIFRFSHDVPDSLHCPVFELEDLDQLWNAAPISLEPQFFPPNWDGYVCRPSPRALFKCSFPLFSSCPDDLHQVSFDELSNKGYQHGCVVRCQNECPIPKIGDHLIYEDAQVLYVTMWNSLSNSLFNIANYIAAPFVEFWSWIVNEVESFYYSRFFQIVVFLVLDFLTVLVLTILFFDQWWRALVFTSLFVFLGSLVRYFLY